MKTNWHQIPDGTHQQFWPNGQLRHEFTIAAGRHSGWLRQWHDNGQIESEKPYANGRLHGLCRQWARDGKLLGSYQMTDGSGTALNWHPNGELESEVSMMDGTLNGRMRCWSHEPTPDDKVLIVQQFFLDGRQVSKKKYDAACMTNPRLPRFADEKVKNTLSRWHARVRRQRQKRDSTD